MPISDKQQKRLEKDMAEEMLHILGPGYVSAYYRQLASGFVSIATSHIEAAMQADDDERRV